MDLKFTDFPNEGLYLLFKDGSRLDLTKENNEEKINCEISKFKEELRLASQNQAKRLNMICKNDAFLNAVVNTQLITELLAMDMSDVLNKAFAEL